MTRRLEGKTALVIGAGSVGPGWGNGKAAAVLFAREGANVLCVDLNEAAAQETVEIIRSEGGQAEPLHADASKEVDVTWTVETCLDRYGRMTSPPDSGRLAEFSGEIRRCPLISAWPTSLSKAFGMPRILQSVPRHSRSWRKSTGARLRTSTGPRASMTS